MNASHTIITSGSRNRGRGSSRTDGTGRRVGMVAAILAILALLTLLAAWLLGWLQFGTDPRVAEILAMQEEARAAFTANGGPATIAEAGAAFAAMGRIREKVEALPEHLRPRVERSGGNMFRNAMRARIDAYFATPPDERQAMLDRHIDQEEMLRKASDLARTVTGGGQGGGERSGQPAAGGQGAGASQPRSDESRANWRKRIIDRTTPEQRARYVEYRRAVEKRRGDRGLPAWPGGR